MAALTARDWFLWALRIRILVISITSVVWLLSVQRLVSVVLLVVLDEDSGGEMFVIAVLRIKGGMPFDVETSWFGRCSQMVKNDADASFVRFLIFSSPR